MNVFIDEIAKQAFAYCDKLGIIKPSHREMFVCGYREGLKSNPWHKASEELPKEGAYILSVSRYRYDTVWYPKPGITDDMDYWMYIPELPKED